MATGLGAQMTAFRSRIAALTPTTATPSTAFRAVGGDLRIEDEPGTQDRIFSVAPGESGGSVGPRWGDAYTEITEPVLVSIRYDARHDADDADARMGQDFAKIVASLEASAARATDTLFVSFRSREIDRAEPEFPVLALTFDVRYQVAL